MATFQKDLPDRSVLQGAAVFQSFTIPERIKHFGADDEGYLRRAAISMAIDRPEMIKAIFNGTRQPAKDFTSPVIAGWSGDLKGSDVLTFNATKAKELWAKADAISPWSGSFEIAYNADGGHQGWVDAVANQIKNNLGIDAKGAPYPTFAELRTAVTDKTIMTAFRTGWQADYPALANFLIPLYQTGAGANDGQYSNADVDALFVKGNQAKSVDEGNKYYQQAQEILLQQLPAIPLWYGITDGGWSTLVSNVQYGWNGVPLLFQVLKK
jgi:oligopeptide transport system substrate-binding protein